MKPINNKVYCNICGAEFAVTKDTLTENEVLLYKELSPEDEYQIEEKRVTLTWLQCPHCGKRYICMMDDVETLELVKDLRVSMLKRLKFLKANRPVPEKLEAKTHRIKRKLDFKRQKLAGEYEGSFYQTEDGKEQLDFRHRVRETRIH